MTLMQVALQSSALDAFLENAENLADGGKVRVEDGLPDSATRDKLSALYAKMDLATAEPETVRKFLQLSLLKVLHKDMIQANHQMTPDTIGLLLAALAERLAARQLPTSVLDLAVGTGNLLYTVVNQLQPLSKRPLAAYGVDNDPDLLAVASVSGQLQGQAVTLLHQDAVSGLDVPQVDLVVSDLPVGYYPLDENTANYQTRAKEGHSYVHHLLIEQATNYLRPGGFGLFLVPADLFKTKETKGFVEWIQSVAYLQGLVNLPKGLFTTAAAEKSILILQRHGANSHQAPKVLLGTFPSFKDQPGLARFMSEVDQWMATNLKHEE